MIVIATGNIWKRPFSEVHGYTKFIDDCFCLSPAATNLKLCCASKHYFSLTPSTIRCLPVESWSSTNDTVICTKWTQVSIGSLNFVHCLAVHLMRSTVFQPAPFTDVSFLSEWNRSRCFYQHDNVSHQAERWRDLSLLVSYWLTDWHVTFCIYTVECRRSIELWWWGATVSVIDWNWVVGCAVWMCRLRRCFGSYSLSLC